jgi:electron-transferring-flavoprotein dehydrogenase
MDDTSVSHAEPAVPRADMRVDIVCTGFGPATAGFLTTLGRAVLNDDGTTRIESTAMPGLPLQVLCFERADDLAAGVSGVVSRARGIRTSFPEFASAGVPLSSPVTDEQIVYLLDPVGASRRSRPLRAIDAMLRAGARLLGVDRHGVRLPYIPPFLRKHDGVVLSLGQFQQWVAGQVMASGAAQIWPASPVAGPLFADDGARVTGVRMVDQGTDLRGAPTPTHRAWTCLPTSRSSAMARSAPWGRHSTRSSACPTATSATSGRSA